VNPPANIWGKLRLHQRLPALHLEGLLRRGVNCVDWSDTGVGKTYVAAAAAACLQLPTLVVAPKIALTSWERAAAHFDDSLSVVGYEKLRAGTSPFGRWSNPPPAGRRSEEFFKCQSCQREVDFDNFVPCYCHPRGIHCVETKKRLWDYGQFIFNPEVKLVIFDEVHRCSATDSLNADMLIAARRQGLRVLGLSATPGTSPLHFKALGYALGLHTLAGPKGFAAWARQHHCRPHPQFRGWHFFGSRETQLATMAQIRNRVIPAFGVRVRTDEIPGFPERDITAELYDLEENKRIDQLYHDMAVALDQLKDRARCDVAPDNPLTTILRAREKIELLKVPVAVELARDFVDKGYSVALFVNFKSALEELRRRLGCDCFIDGTQTGAPEKRQIQIDRFQSDASRYVVVNSKAGGVACNLHDIRGEFPRVGLVFPSVSATDTVQVFGRLHRDGGKSRCFYRVLLAAGTVETGIFQALQGKLNNLESLTDADLLPEKLRLTKVEGWTKLGA